VSILGAGCDGGGLQFEVSLSKKLARPYLKNKLELAGDVAQVVECLPSTEFKPQYCKKAKQKK
jgi:hypothetical protein